MRQVRPGTDGTFAVAAPPGEYHLCALTELEPSSLSDPAFLEQLVAGSIKVSLGEGATVRQDIKIAGGG